MMFSTIFWDMALSFRPAGGRLKNTSDQRLKKD
jgi:hypothetical protein